MNAILNNIFGGMGVGLIVSNGIFGIALIVLGALLNKRSETKGKKTIGVTCVVIGIIAVVVAAARIIL